MTTVLAELVDDVEEVEDEDVEVESELRALVDVRDDSADVEVKEESAPAVDVLPVDVLPVDVLPVDVLPVREDRALVDVSDEPEVDVLLVEVPLVDVPDVEAVCPVTPVFTEADATPDQTIPTSVIPAATAATRLMVVRRPGLISHLSLKEFPDPIHRRVGLPERGVTPNEVSRLRFRHDPATGPTRVPEHPCRFVTRSAPGVPATGPAGRGCGARSSRVSGRPGRGPTSRC